MMLHSVIGDPALQIDRKRYHTVDLAEEWIRHYRQAVCVRILGGAGGCAVGSFSCRST